jgi:hypothetical protein
MKLKVFIGLAACFVGMTAFAQGTIIFNNRTGPVDAPVSRPDGTGAGAGVTAQLFLVGGGGALTPLVPTTTFRTSTPAAAFYLNQVTVVVPGIPAGSPATVRMRVWEGASWEAAAVRAQSNDVAISQLGGIPPGGGAPIPDALLLGLQPIIPEPATLSLVLLGAAFLVRRRK